MLVDIGLGFSLDGDSQLPEVVDPCSQSLALAQASGLLGSDAALVLQIEENHLALRIGLHITSLFSVIKVFLIPSGIVIHEILPEVTSHFAAVCALIVPPVAVLAEGQYVFFLGSKSFLGSCNVVSVAPFDAAVR